MADERGTNAWPAGMTGRGLRGRRMARLMIVIAIVPAVMLGVLFVLPPATIGPMQIEDPSPLWAIVVGAGIIGYLTGLAVMIRIYRADPERHSSWWRSRRY
ncbi:MAG TPA: hypothetical protein VFY18_10325 [Candidatus Limnocylindrales bacterium]|nr:hypothetical protein [Candidatus Limnocylindrales bacterium]